MSQDRYRNPIPGYSQRSTRMPENSYRPRARPISSLGRRVAFPWQKPRGARYLSRSTISSRSMGSRSSSWDSLQGDRQRAGTIHSRGYRPSIRSGQTWGSMYSGLSSRLRNDSIHSQLHSQHSGVVPRSSLNRSGREISLHSLHPSGRFLISLSHTPTVDERELHERLRRQLSLQPSSRYGTSRLSTSGRESSRARRGYSSDDGSTFDPIHERHSGYSSSSG